MSEAYTLAIGILIGVAIAVLIILGTGFVVVAAKIVETEKRYQQDSPIECDVVLEDGTVHRCVVKGGKIDN